MTEGIPMSDDKTPVEQALDLMFYAPIGLLFEGPSLLPKLAEQGRVHVRNARFFGEFAAKQGSAELRRRLEDLEEQATGWLQLLGLLPSNDRDQAAPSAAATSRVADVVDLDRPAPDVDTLAIPGYDSLSASQVVTRLPGLTSDELESVRAYEVGHRGRKTILNKVAQLQGRH